MNTDPVVIERTLHAPVTKVWQAITNNDEMKKWYFNIDAFKPEPGFKFHFSGGSEERTYLHLCTVTQVVENKKLSYTWSYEGYEGTSLVTFQLFDEGEQTRVKLTHEGLETFPQVSKDFSKESFTAGWTHIIGTSLKEFVEK